MKLIVGLGNPGIDYENTRHNTGFMALNALLEDFSPVSKTFWKENSPLKSEIARVEVEGREIMLARPITHMNNSGYAIKMLLEKNAIKPLEMILIHDDVDLPLGKIRVRIGGASAGHRGVQSVIDQLKDDKFLRIRMGIGRPIKIEGEKYSAQRGVEDYVLANFTSSEHRKAKTMIKEVSRIVRHIIKDGIEKYMSKYNNK